MQILLKNMRTFIHLLSLLTIIVLAFTHTANAFPENEKRMDPFAFGGKLGKRMDPFAFGGKLGKRMDPFAFGGKLGKRMDPFAFGGKLGKRMMNDEAILKYLLSQDLNEW
ncbi:hypothetical protein SNEBB_003210 [Seison nebaliae]|nr:hypothetical protein SNEBB_003210 [Seison nebaliae]